MLISIQKHKSENELEDGIVRLFITLIKVMDFTMVSLIMLDHGMYGTLGDLEVTCSRQGLIKERDALVSAMFIAALKKDKMSLAQHMITTYTSILL